MTGCAEYMDAIIDSALSDVVTSPLAEHLAICPGCAAALRGARASASRLNLALQKQATVDPPPFGPDRVITRIQARKRVRTKRRWWMWAGVAGAAAMLVLFLWMARQKPKVEDATIASWQSPTRALLKPPVGMAWNTTPRFGRSMFEIKDPGGYHAQ